MRMKGVLVKGGPQGSPFFVRSAWGAEEVKVTRGSLSDWLAFVGKKPMV